jgi:hypothetical protein
MQQERQNLIALIPAPVPEYAARQLERFWAAWRNAYSWAQASIA